DHQLPRRRDRRRHHGPRHRAGVRDGRLPGRALRSHARRHRARAGQDRREPAKGRGARQSGRGRRRRHARAPARRRRPARRGGGRRADDRGRTRDDGAQGEHLPRSAPVGAGGGDPGQQHVVTQRVAHRRGHGTCGARGGAALLQSRAHHEAAGGGARPRHVTGDGGRRARLRRAHRQGAHRGHGHAGVRLVAPGRGAGAGGDADGGGGRRVAAGHRPGDGAGLQPSHGPAEAHGRGRPRRTARDRRVPARRAGRRAVPRPRDPAPHGGRGAAGEEERARLLRLGGQV
ncbi:MAG: 3-hydroxybutyryl-CoA dehydrogenase; 3-hydroxyacyl-CoA dehydrogenase, partial [uncultured Gemmatimonadetes bacterium]